MAAPPPDDPLRPPDDPETGDTTAGLCPRCDAPFEPLQEYCLECGLRLPAADGPVLSGTSARLGSRYAWFPGAWILPVILAFIIAALGAAVAVWASSGGEPGPRTLASPPPTETLPPTTAPATTAVTLTAPEPPATTAAPVTTRPRPRPRPQPRRLQAWPAGKSGYTIVLASVPADAGRAVADRMARRALAARVPNPGVLESSKYPSLHPGYYVVFSGVFDSEAEANSALSTVKARGYRAAYPRQITASAPR